MLNAPVYWLVIQHAQGDHMNEKEHMLVCLSEECAEVIKAVSKALRFGLNDGYPNSGRTNLQDIMKEMVHVNVVLDMLQEKGIVYRDYPGLELVASTKKRKVEQYIEYAVSTGTLVV